MNREIERIIKKNQYRSKFYQTHKKPKERETKKLPLNHESNELPSDEHTEEKKMLYIPFYLKVLLSALLLVIGMIIKKDPKLESVQQMVFTNINLKRVELVLTSKLGGIFPLPKNDDLYVNLPVVDLSNTEDYEDGVIVQTDIFEGVTAHVDGYVVGIENREGLGKVIRIEDANGKVFEYGMLEDVKVLLYYRVKQGDLLGMAKTSQDYEGGEFYLAIKDKTGYLDVIDVVNDID